jgi:hypothetical protein
MAARSAHEPESSRCAGRDSSATIACSPLSSAVLLPSRRRCATGGAPSVLNTWIHWSASDA